MFEIISKFKKNEYLKIAALSVYLADRAIQDIFVFNNKKKTLFFESISSVYS